MADIFDSAKRSKVMAAIRGKGNKDTEIRMITLFRSERITGWRRGVPLVGKPDFVFRRERVAVFVDGCFWHGCPRHGRIPDSRREYWLPKLSRNKARDRLVTRTLRQQGWAVIRVWECELAKAKRGPGVARRVRRALARVAAGGS